MAEPLPVVRLKNAWNSTHPWIFQRLVEKPAQRPKPGSIVDVEAVDGTWIGRGFYNGHSRIALRMLERDPDVAVDAAWFVRKIGEAIRLRREILRLDDVSNAWRVVHSEGDGISGLVVDRYDDLLVVRTANEDDKRALVEADGPFFTIPHFSGYNAVLVRLSRIGEVTRDELEEVLTEAWRACAPKALVKEYLAEGRRGR